MRPQLGPTCDLRGAREGVQGQGYPAGSVAFQKDLYAALKADAATRDLPVYGIALGLGGQPPCSNANPLGNAGELAASVDFGNFHPYPSGNPWHPDFAYDFVPAYYHQTVFPSALLDPNPGPGLTGFDDVTCIGRKPYGTRPMVATETGVQTTSAGIPESHQGALVPRIVLENFRLGIARSLLYELADSGGETFGLLRGDATPRPAYHAMTALLSKLADPGPTFVPDSLDYDLALSPATVDAGDASAKLDRLEYVHHLLLQKRSGAFELVLWHEIATDATYPTYVSLAPPAIPAVLTLHRAFGSASVTTVDESSLSTSRAVDVHAPIALAVSERFQIVELVPASSGDAGADAGHDGDAGPGSADAGGTSDATTGGSASPVDGAGGCGCVFTRSERRAVNVVRGVQESSAINQ